MSEHAKCRGLCLATVAVAALALLATESVLTVPRLRAQTPGAPSLTVPQWQLDAGGKLAFEMGARKVTMDLLAAELSEFDSSVDRPVLDRSGLSGTFDLMLQWAPQPRDLPTGPVDVLVVDHIEEPSPN